MWTVGHSTHPLPAFVALVRAHGVTSIADVRKLPRSRRHPHFNVDTLPDALEAGGLGYTHFAGLGGLRHEQPGSVNRAWKNPSFRAYADYMQTDVFVGELDRLLSLGHRERVAIMCAEAVCGGATARSSPTPWSRAASRCGTSSRPGAPSPTSCVISRAWRTDA